MTDSKVGSYSFVAEPFHVDFTGRIFMGVLGNHFLNCAGFHSSERNFGIAQLQEKNYTWVLSRLAIEMEDMPRQYAEFSIDTWVENVYRLFTDRNFSVYGKDGKVYGYVRSVWAMIDMETRKPVDLLAVNGGRIVNYIENEKPCPIEKPGRIKVGSGMPMRTIPTYYHDIDINGHVNSIKYVEHVLDLFDKDWYSNHVIRRFEMAYVAETYYGDTLSFFREEHENDTYDIEVRKNVGGTVAEGEVVCRSKIKFDNK